MRQERQRLPNSNLIADICNMHIVIVAATALEIQPLLDLRQTAGIDTAGWEVLITGVGAVATTYSLMETIARKKPGLMIQAGIAGCFEKSSTGTRGGHKGRSICRYGCVGIRWI